MNKSAWEIWPTTTALPSRQLSTTPVVQLMTLDVAVEVIRRAIAEFRTAPRLEAEPSYTPAEFGAKYGRSAKWARGLIARGELGSYQRVPGGRHTILAAHEAAWLEVPGW